jgi:hypothetical protein
MPIVAYKAQFCHALNARAGWRGGEMEEVNQLTTIDQRNKRLPHVSEDMLKP